MQVTKQDGERVRELVALGERRNRVLKEAQETRTILGTITGPLNSRAWELESAFRGLREARASSGSHVAIEAAWEKLEAAMNAADEAWLGTAIDLSARVEAASCGMGFVLVNVAKVG